MTLRTIHPGIEYIVQIAGQSVKVCDHTYELNNIPMNELGGMIINPLSAKDQGIHIAESIFVNLLGPASSVPALGNTEIVPGQWFLVPPGADAWVNAKTAGHRFTSYFTSNFRPPEPAQVVPGQPGSGLPALGAEPGARPFPPPNVTGLTTVIPSYLYQQYTDDDDLQGWCEAQNEMQQNYVDTFNALNLPIYTGPIVQGALLDWVGRGLYGMARPVIGPETQSSFGPLNTYGCNWLVPMWDTFTPAMEVVFGLNVYEHYDFENLTTTTDDIYRRVITWHFFKQDGNYFSIEFLKRRVWRFLYGVDGKHWDYIDMSLGAAHPYPRWPGSVADLDDAYIADRRQISVTMGANRSVCIRFVLGERPVNGGAMLNVVGCNGFNPLFGAIPPGRSGPWQIGTDPVNAPDFGITMNDLETSFTPLPRLPMMKTFKEALDLGVLEVPYQFDFSCKIG